jgi:hypothetical protein
MNDGRTIFSQLMDFVPMHEFRAAVKRYDGERYVKTFSCWDQFLSMAFAQLTYRESLRDIETCLRALKPHLYHSGIRGHIARSTLADANESRSWKIYRDIAIALIKRARVLYRGDVSFKEIEGAVYAFDSTTIELCLKLFSWATASGHTATNAAIKLHTLLDVQSHIPTLILLTPAKVNDMNMLDHLPIEVGAYYILDRGYMSLRRLYLFLTSLAFFVTRAKRDLRFKRIYSHPVDKSAGVIVDQTIRLTGWKSKKDYPSQLRRIKFYDERQGKYFVFLTNNFSLPALVIAELYRSRWQVELFFKWIKQHLRIKAFYGTSENAVLTQVWIAVCVYVLVAIVKKELSLDHSFYTILQILSVSLFQKEPILQALQQHDYKFDDQALSNQLCLFDF